jgi:hypothetical protein
MIGQQTLATATVLSLAASWAIADGTVCNLADVVTEVRLISQDWPLQDCAIHFFAPPGHSRLQKVIRPCRGPAVLPYPLIMRWYAD